MSIEDTSTATAEIIADLARRADAAEPHTYEVTHGTEIVVTKLRADERIATLDLSRFLPEPSRSHGHADVRHPADFAELVNRLAEPALTTVWADERAGTVTAVINDHGSEDCPGWRDHTVKLTLQSDADWERWALADGKLVQQEDFAEFVEDSVHTITDPEPATLLEIALTFQAKRGLEFEQGLRQDTGDVRLRFMETSEATAGAKGDLEIPETITVSLSPWIGATPVELRARLRWRIRDRRLVLGYRLHRADLARTQAFAAMVSQIRDGLAVGLPVFLGPAPSPVRVPNIQ